MLIRRHFPEELDRTLTPGTGIWNTSSRRSQSLTSVRQKASVKVPTAAQPTYWHTHTAHKAHCRLYKVTCLRPWCPAQVAILMTTISQKSLYHLPEINRICKTDQSCQSKMASWQSWPLSNGRGGEAFWNHLRRGRTTRGGHLRAKRDTNARGPTLSLIFQWGWEDEG